MAYSNAQEIMADASLSQEQKTAELLVLVSKMEQARKDAVINGITFGRSSGGHFCINGTRSPLRRPVLFKAEIKALLFDKHAEACEFYRKNEALFPEKAE